MNAQCAEFPTVVWPAPPFFQFAARAPESMCAGIVQWLNGRRASGLLVDFAAERRYLNFWPDGGEPEDVALDQIRFIRLAAPGIFVHALTATTEFGSTPGEHKEHHQSFIMEFKDGERLDGVTLGARRETAGLFLYLVESDTTELANYFIPENCIKELRLNATQGDSVADSADTVPDLRALLSTDHPRKRQEQIEKYLSNRTVSTVEDLLHTRLHQGKRLHARLGDILIETGAISSEQLDKALTIQGEQRSRRLGDILVEMGVVSVRLIQVALSDKLGIPYVSARSFPVGLGVLELIDTAFAIRHQVLPLIQTNDCLIVAVENPLAVECLTDLRFQLGKAVEAVIADPLELKERIAKEYSGLESRVAIARSTVNGFGTFESSDLAGVNAFKTNVADLTSQLVKESQSGQRTTRDVISDPRVTENTLVRLVNKIIIEAHAQGASDIHIETNGIDLHTRIRFRKDGDLEDYLQLPQAYSNSLVSRIKIMADLDISERRHPQDGKIDFGRHGPLPIELRVAVIPTANGLEDVVLRILSAAEALPLDEVGFSAADLLSLRTMIKRTFGLILVCGPTGSGKTTTLHSLLRDINRPDLKIWTAEDPVEITQRGLRQVQVNAKIDWTFAAAMRAFLRADPDVIMVGEMRDGETTKIGIEASLTGHLVFSTLHTNSAAESVVRLLDLGMDPFNFADALIGVLSQRLARKLCPGCKQSRPASDAEIEELLSEYCQETSLVRTEVLKRWHEEFATGGELILHEAGGCEACKLGYKGRVVVYELLAATAGVKQKIRSRAVVPEVLALAQDEGMLSLRQHTIRHVLRGVLDLAGARAVSS